MKFVIITYILHKEHNNSFYSYEPYIREMNMWLTSPKQVIVVAPKIYAIPSSIETPYLNNNISFRKIPSISFLNFQEILRSCSKFPGICIGIFRAMKEADHIHLRCPGNISLIACFIQILFPKKPKTAKYAGNWDPTAQQPWSYELQKWILSNTFLTRNMKVLVYGDWPGQSKNILPFFTASFSESEIERIEKDFSVPFKFLFVGNLVPGKQPLFAVQLVKTLNEKNFKAELHVFGDGEMMDVLKAQAGNKSYIHLYGNQSLEIVKQAYKDSQFLILASKSEGWPKAVAEAMFFGSIPIATGVSCVPWILGGGSRGILAPPAPEGGAPKVTVTGRGILIPTTTGGGKNETDWIEETNHEIQKLIKNPEEMRRMSMEAQEWSQEYTLEKFEKAIKEVLELDNVYCKKSSSTFGRGGGVG